jgi:hypothetical protein
MHDLDRTQMEYSSEFYGPRAGGGVFSEEEQMNIAADMMELNSEEEFEDFLGDLISKGVQAVGSFIGAPAAQALGGVLKGAAKHLLPIAGQALGGFIGGPAGAQIGGQLGSAAFEAEMEEQDWEAANTFVKLAADTVQNLAAAPPGSDPAAAAHNAVVEAAKVQAPAIVPALLNGGLQHPEPHRHHRHQGHSGHWVRQGDRIVLYGV